MEFTPVGADDVPLATTAQYVASGCAGTFFTPTEVNNRLEWGAEQTCTGTYAPQYIRMRLQSTCSGWYCARFGNETSFRRTPGSEDYSQVSRLSYADYCATGTFRKYRVEAIPYVRGVQFAPKFSNESVQACDISP